MRVQSAGKKLIRGIATLEILIAFAILILCMSAVIMISFGNQSVALDSQNNIEAITKAQELLEKARADSRQDFNLVNPTSVADMSGLLSYTKTLSVDTSATDPSLDIWTKRVKSIVSWQSAGRTLSTMFTTLLTNFDGSGETCSSVLSGDWKNPQFTTFEFGKDLIGDAVNIFPISSLDVYKNKLFVTINNSNASIFNTFFEFNLASPAAPTFLAGIDNDNVTKIGLNSVKVTDNYAYVANAKQSNFATCVAPGCGQLQIIDISANPPVLKTTFKIPGVTGTGGQGVGQSIMYKNGLVYLGLAKTLTGPEFNIINVSNPLAPIYLGGYSVGNAINSIAIKNGYAYIASPNSENMTVLNISNSASPVRVGGYSPAGGSNGESIKVIGNNVYLGRTFGTNEFYILDATSPSSISVLASKDIGSGNKTSINEILVRDYLAFVITNDKLHIWNIADKNNIYPWTPNSLATEFKDLPGGKGTAMDCENNYIYVSSLPASDKANLSIITAN